MGSRTVHRKPGTVAAIAAVVLGWLLLSLAPGLSLVNWSYDLLQLCLPAHTHADVVLIHMDEQAMQEYNQKPGEPWPRAIHARLLDRLSRDQARVVVFDVTLTQAADPVGDETLARAIRRNGRVVLAADRVPVLGVPLGYTIVPPLPLFETNAATWGTAKVHLDSDRVGRRYDAGDDQQPGLDWAAAKVAGASLTQDPDRRLREVRWLNYYGSGRPFEATSMTYTNAETRESGFFRGKAVFIGGKPETLLRGEITDVFGTPFTKWNSHFILGVEIAAIAYANLVHEEWLHRLGFPAEAGLLLLSGALLGLGFQRLPGPRIMLVSMLVLALLLAATITALLLLRVWFPWAIIGLAQLPCAVLFRLTGAASASPVDSSRGRDSQSAGPSEDPALGGIPSGSLTIPDHTLIRCIGEGAYGQVWIARNAIGLYHAVKVVYRSRFGTEIPFERAFRGIQKFMPISRSHDGFVHILHVGRNDAAGSFFYIMEAGDDVKSGQQIDPGAYVPRTLGSELRLRQSIPARECLEFLIALTEAVTRLHEHQLIHRDIKPANIIFVNGRPKLADIDLVTDLSPTGPVSRIGTEGYMAPEGPGTAAADVFSLGRILYVVLTGKSPEQIPELPTRLASQTDGALVMELIQIACKSSDPELTRRHASAAALRADLMEVLRRQPGERV